jgi:hypothetical protein
MGSSKLVEALSKEGMKLSFSPKLVQKLVPITDILFCKFSFPVKHLIPYSAETGHFRSLIT